MPCTFESNTAWWTQNSESIPKWSRRVCAPLLKSSSAPQLPSIIHTVTAMHFESKKKLLYNYFFIFFLSYLTWVDHPVYNTVLPWFPGWGVQIIRRYPDRNWLHPARSLSSTATVPRVSCSNGASSNGNRFLGFTVGTRNWTGDSSHQSRRP